MKTVIGNVIILTFLLLRVSSQRSLPNDVILSGSLSIHGIKMSFYRGTEHDQENLLSAFRNDICNYVSQYGSPIHTWEFQCSVEMINSTSSYVSTKLRTPREDWYSWAMPMEDSFVEAYVGISLSHYVPSNAVTTYDVSIPNTLVILLCTARSTTMQSSKQYRSPFIRSNPKFLELRKDFCNVIEHHRISDSKFRNVEVECSIISVNPSWTTVELYLMINNNDLDNVRISRDKDAIALAVQNAFGGAVFRHKGATYGWQIIDPPSGKVPTYFLLRGRIHWSGQQVQFDSEQHAAKSLDLSNLVGRICTSMEAHGSLAVIYPDRTFECQFKRYNTETSEVTIFVTVRGFDHATFNQLQEALRLSAIHVQDGDINYNAHIVNRENLAPQLVPTPLDHYHVTIILSFLNALHYDRQSKQSVQETFRQIDEHVCNHIRPQISRFPNSQCKVTSFDPVTRMFEARIAIPLDMLRPHEIRINGIDINLNGL